MKQGVVRGEEDIPFHLLDSTSLFLVIFLTLLVLCVIFLISWFNYRSTHRPPIRAVSPYSNFPLRELAEIPHQALGKLYLFYLSQRGYENRLPDFHKIAVCSETGRVFEGARNFLGHYFVDWNFLSKKYPGTYVSWGSLTDVQKQRIRQLHPSLEGYQFEYSSKNPIPRKIEREFALSKPGPLYVDLESGVLLGWKIVPGTDLEILVVQKPQ